MEVIIMSLLLNAVKGLIKNPSHAFTFKQELIALRDVIESLFPGE